MRPVREALLQANALREYFSLDQAVAHAAHVPEALRAEVRDARALVARKRAAADVLWRDGDHAEALALCWSAFDLLTEARARLAAAVSVPECDARVDAASYERSQEACGALDEVLAPLSLDEPGLWRMARRRTVVTSALVAVVVGASAVWSVSAGSLHAEASASYDLTFPSSNAIDGNLETEWLLPDRSTGSLELRFSRPRAARTLVLVNSLNSPYNDRGTHAYRVEVYAPGGRLARAVDGVFPPPSSVQGRVTLDLAGTGKIERIKFIVLGYDALGGGLAEAIVR